MIADGAIFPDFYGETIFCDDIRYEQSGKVSYIGVYQGDMIFVQPLPSTIPKFGFSVLFAQKKDLFDPNLRLKIFLPGDPEDQPSIEADLPPPDAMPVSADPNPSLITMRALFIVTPLLIKQEGRIRVRIVRQGITYRAGALYVRSAPEQPTSSPSAPAPPA